MEDSRWMESALALARRSLGRTWPNPAVGTVIVRNGRVLGRGATAPGGRPHAETIALAHARERHGPEALQGATAYVSLEPCAHHGRTPPCTDALIEAGIARVVCPMIDPDPRVAGRGAEALRSAGVEVRTGVLAAEAARVNAGFLSRLQRGRPHVVLKLAATLDGRIATRRGESRWITGGQARRRAHLMRTQHDAVLIGAGTARADNPMLDVRGLGQDDRAPVRVLADGALSVPLTGRLVRTAEDQPLWILHRAGADASRREALADLGAAPIAIDTGPDGVLSMPAAMAKLAERGITRLLCEGGGRLAASLLVANLVDEIALFTAGKAIGGDGVPAVHGFGLERLDGAPLFTLERVEAVGTDVLSWWRAA
jgi:diaminohydroxyphosphoribosylaminopyrimidine deaminase / 5-amino-6-(5-phosphoribosylamino)uracil reductase